MTSITLEYNIDNLQEFYTTGLYSDLVLLCGDHCWNLHRAIVHQSSPSFAATRDSDCEDGGEATVTLNNEVPELLNLVVQYFYNHAYADDDVIGERDEDGTIVFTSSKAEHDEASNVSDDFDDLFYVKSAQQLHSCLLVNVHIYAMAESFKIPGLKQLAVCKFKQRLKEQGQWPYYKFTEIIATILNRTTDQDDSLRPIVLELLNQHASEVLGQHDLLESPYYEGCEEWMNVLSQHPGFVLDLWSSTAVGRAATL